MRRTHATLTNEIDDDPKMVADQLGHTLDVSQNVYTRASVAKRKEAVDALESALPVMQFSEVLERALKTGDAKLFKRWSGRRGSNSRRSAWEADILPLNYSRTLIQQNYIRTITHAVPQPSSTLPPRTAPLTPSPARHSLHAASSSPRRHTLPAEYRPTHRPYNRLAGRLSF